MTVVADFLEEFHRVHGRPPRVLHVGNIANNAYLNAKLLNREGFDCDVICPDYYYIMGCPEWEDVDFDGVIADRDRPDWTALDLRGFQRPRWFAQGPRETCIEYLVAKRTGQAQKAAELWQHLGWANRTLPRPRHSNGRRRLQHLRYRLATARRLISRAHHYPDAYGLAAAKIREWGSHDGGFRRVMAAALLPFASVAIALVRLSPYTSRTRTSTQHGSSWEIEWPSRFKATFSDRLDQLSPEDLAPYMWMVPAWQRLFQHYDIIQAYGADVMFPMLAEKRPYVGFEHGTLRVFTLADTPLARLTALGYNRADHVFITNGDCLEYAHRIKVTSYTPMPHPFDDAFMRTVPDDSAALHAEYGVKYLFLCPLRHDWEIKGTDKYIRALPKIVESIGRDFRVIMTEWGEQVDASKRLAKALGVDDLIVWRQPFNRVQLVRHLKSVDVVFDQIALPCFGGTAPQSIGVGIPVTMSYDPASTEWLIPEAAPILSAWTAEDIVSAVNTALNPAWRAHYKVSASRWYEQHHSAREVVCKHAKAYESICRSTGLLPTDTTDKVVTQPS